MAGEPIYFGRRYRLTIHPPGGDETVFETEAGEPAMDIKFDVTYAKGQTAREGTVSILGLGFKTIHAFLTLAGETRGMAMSKLVRVKLEAGYFSQAGMVEVLNGFAWYATVTSPPQMWLTLRVSEYNPLGGRAITIPSHNEPKNLSILCNSIATQFSDEETAEGLPIVFVDKTEHHVFGNEQSKRMIFPEKVTLKDTIEILNRDASDKVVFTMRTNGTNGERVIEAHDKSPEKAVDVEDVIVDKDNGLLSVTGIDAVNGCITTFIDGRYPDELTHLQLTSELNQIANGRYYIVKKQYVGHFMGQEWYTRYFCSARVKV